MHLFKFRKIHGPANPVSDTCDGPPGVVLAEVCATQLDQQFPAPVEQASACSSTFSAPSKARSLRGWRYFFQALVRKLFVDGCEIVVQSCIELSLLHCQAVA